MPQADVERRLQTTHVSTSRRPAQSCGYILDEAGGDLLTAIGYYHSHTPALADAYRLHVVASAAHLFGGRKGADHA